MAAEVLTEKRIEAQAEQQTQKARMSGIAMAGGPAFESQSMAGGGIIAFAGEGPSLVEDPQFGGGDLNADQARMDQIKLQKDMQQYEFLKEASPVAAERLLANNPMLRAKVAPPAAPPAAAPKPEARPPEVRPPAAPARTEPSNVGTGIKSLEEQMKEQERLMGPNTGNEGLNAKIAERLANMDKQASQDDRAAMRRAFVEFGTKASPGGFLQGATSAIGTYGDARDAAKKARESMDLELTKMQADIKKGERAERRGNLDAAAKSFESAENRQLRVAEMQNQVKIAGMQASRASEFERQYEAFKNDPAKFEQFRKSLTAQDDTARLNAYVKADTALGGNTKYLQLINSKKPEDQAKAEKMRSDKITEYLGALGINQAPAAAAPQAGPDGTVNIPGKGTFKQLPNGNYVKV
jgi:hypothetical protein